MKPADDSLVLLDQALVWEGAAKIVADWSRLDPGPDRMSIPGLVEQHALDIRREYLRWVYDLGQLEIRGQSVRAHLQLFGEFSFWWMTLIAEKEPLKTEAIYTVFKLRALEKLYDEQECRGLIYCGSDRRLNQMLSQWCHKLGHRYEWRRPARPLGHPPGERLTWQQRVRRWLPHPLQAMLLLAWRWAARLRHVRPFESQTLAASPTPQVTIVTYFPNVDLEQTRQGRFWSHYWEQFHELLDELPVRVNWVWLYATTEQCTYTQTLALRDRCNAARPHKYRHFVIEEFLQPRAIGQVLLDYLRLCWRGLLLSPIREQFRLPGSQLNFYPAMQADWESSLFGRVAIEGLLYIAAFDEMARRVPAKPWGMFIWENQPWELALMAAWRRHAAGRIIAVQHSAFGRLSLRSFADMRAYDEPSGRTCPLPDVLAVNGTGMWTLMREAGFPEQRLTQVEALRYLGLSRQDREATPRAPSRILLVIAGYRRSEVEFQLHLLNQAAQLCVLKGFEAIWIKPHPFCPIKPILVDLPPQFEHEIVTVHLSKLWGQVERVLVANSTAAVIEAIYERLPVGVCAAENSMNLSPAFGDLAVPMLATAPDLIRFLELRAAPTGIVPADYFILDPDLPRWRNLLSAV